MNTAGTSPKHPFPVFYVGYFAVTLQQQGRGLGRRLMGDALRRCLEGAAHVGAGGVYLDSLDDRSTAFYRRLGFTEIARAPGTPASGPQPMFLPMRDLQAAKPGSTKHGSGFFATLEHELLAGADFATRAEAHRAVAEFIEPSDNAERRHSTLDYVSPIQYERQLGRVARAA